MSDKETIDGVLRALLDAPAVNTDVRTILLDIVPGEGSGREVYARSCADVEKVLTELWIRIEDMETDRTRGEPVAWIKEHWSGKSADFHYKTLVDVVFKDDWKPLYAEQPESVAINKPTTINYSALDAEDRLAVCRGECTKDEAAKNLLIKNLLRKVRATLHFTPEDVLAIDAVLRDDVK